MSLSNKDNFFFVDKDIIKANNTINKEKLNSEENTRSYSFSTTETDMLSDDDIDFNQDFFPKIKTIKFTDFLADNWENKIKMYMLKKNNQLSKTKNNNSNINIYNNNNL